MKHSTKITLILLTIFFITQFFGLAVIHNYIDQPATLEAGETIFKELPIGERPDIAEETSYVPIILIVLFGTLILFALIKFKAFVVWRIWFLLAVFMTTLVAIASFINTPLALILAIILSLWKVFKPNPIVHNFSEIFVYAGLAAIFVPIFNIKSIIILLILISFYDMYAVWKSKHMITLAKSQAKAQVFAGLLIPYSMKKIKIKFITKKATKTTKKSKISKKKIPIKVRVAILGGGDIGFPLIFAGVVMKEIGLIPSLIIPFFTTLGLGLLFFYSKEKKFYPAMPFISAACFIGLGFVYLIF